MTRSADDQAFLSAVLPPVRDPKTGRYLKGSPGGLAGRTLPTKAYNFRGIVADFIEAHGGYTEDVVIDIFQSLLTWSRLGDTTAAKILLDKLCGKDDEHLNVNVTSPLSDVERAARLNAILAAAARRATDNPMRN